MRHAAQVSLNITGDPGADALLEQSPFALLAGMLLDQQFPMEHAFAGPAKIRDRLGSFDPATVAAADQQEFAALCARPPAVHRYPGSMAARLQALAGHVLSEYDGEAAAVWSTAPSAAELFRRLRALPGFGETKARIFVALLAKQIGVRPPGWREVAGDYGEEGYRSVADVVDAASLAQVREHKRQMKAASRR